MKVTLMRKENLKNLVQKCECLLKKSQIPGTKAISKINNMIREKEMLHKLTKDHHRKISTQLSSINTKPRKK